MLLPAHICGQFVLQSRLVPLQHVASFLFLFLANKVVFLYPFSHDTSVCFSSHVMLGHLLGLCPEGWPFFVSGLSIDNWRWCLSPAHYQCSLSIDIWRCCLSPAHYQCSLSIDNWRWCLSPAHYQCSLSIDNWRWCLSPVHYQCSLCIDNS